jgi:hypothetical protein
MGAVCARASRPAPLDDRRSWFIVSPAAAVCDPLVRAPGPNRGRVSRGPVA